MTVALSDLSVSPPLPPLARPVAIDDLGSALMPHPFDPGAGMRLPVGEGLTIDWTPVDRQRILIAVWAGTADRHSDESIATVISRSDLQQMLLALMSIDQQMGDL